MAWNPPCDACLTAESSAPIEMATRIVLVVRDGIRERLPVCARHAAAAQRYRAARGIPMHAPLRAVEAQAREQRVH